jgi:hypothetical protein
MGNGDQFKSKLKEDDHVSVCIDGENEAFRGWVVGIHKVEGQIKYSVEVRFPDGRKSTFPLIESGFVYKINEIKPGL